MDGPFIAKPTDAESRDAIRKILLAGMEKIEGMFLPCLQHLASRDDRGPLTPASAFVELWLPSLPEALRIEAERYIGGERRLRLLRLVREETASRTPELAIFDRLSRATAACESNCAAPGALVAAMVRSTPIADVAFQRVVDVPEIAACFWLLVDYLWPGLSAVAEAAASYYGIEYGKRAPEFRMAMWHATFQGLVQLDPAIGERYTPRCARIGQVYTIGLLECIRWNLLTNLGILGFVGRREDGTPDIGSHLSAIKDDRFFVAEFRNEWERLLGFEHGAYGFLAEPNIGWTDMTRYLSLCYGLNEIVSHIPGCRKEIRWETCNYLLHRSLVAIEVLRIPSPDKVAELYESEVALIFRPLIEGVAARLAVARTAAETEVSFRGATTGVLKSHEKKIIAQYRETALAEAEGQFRLAYEDFDFFRKSHLENVERASLGLLRQSGKHRWVVPPIRGDWNETDMPGPAKEWSFPNFVEKRLKRWMRKEIASVIGSKEAASRPDRGSNLTVPHKNETMEKHILVAPDGSKWVTIRTLGKLLRGVPLHRLRALDEELHPTRAAEVFASDLTVLGDLDLTSGTRLYKSTEDLVSRASEALGALISRRRRASTKGLTQAEICRIYSIPRSTLVYWESVGLVVPVKDGRNKIYPPDQERAIAARYRNP